MTVDSSDDPTRNGGPVIGVRDLVTPLLTAARGDASTEQGFRGTHASLLATLRRQRAPWSVHDTLPTVTDAIAARAHDTALHARIREVADHARARGCAPATVEVLLFAAFGPGDVVDALPHPTHPVLVLALDRLEDPLALEVALARGLALLARWTGQQLPMPAPWDRLAVAAQVPLAEWVYAEGLAHHLIADLYPDTPAHRRLGLNRGTYDRLRHQESALLDALEADLPRRGIGPWARWLDPAPPVGAVEGLPGTPGGAIGYLAWRLLEERVQRVGLAEAAEMPA